MNKKVYKKVVHYMNEYRKFWIYQHKHDQFLYGYIMGLLESLYLSGAIDIISSCRLQDYVMHKTDLYTKKEYTT